jgi:phosphopantothenoylcysteine decarboxylase/phosphopantothenate--cysteine ligase
VDILADLGRWRAGRPHPVLVGFAAETDSVIDYAVRKRAAKQADLIVANDVSQVGAGFDVDTNIASFVTADGVQSFPLEAKSALAARIVDFVAQRLAHAAAARPAGPAVAVSSTQGGAAVPLSAAAVVNAEAGRSRDE